MLLVAFGVYSSTVSPTVDFWDCGEFIASANGLQVPHPPGAPLYLLVGRLFALLAPGEMMTALAVNMLSVTASAFTVFFIYKILILLIGMLSAGDIPFKRLIIEFAAVTGALLFAFTDTFWTSAVESEVYALSLFFSSASLWVFLSWYMRDEMSPRWFFAGVYLLGLSLGVHLLNLLLVPVFALLFGWKRYGTRLHVTVKSLAGGALILGFLFWGVVSNGLWPGRELELFMVNSMGMPQHSGLITWVIGLIAVHVFGLLFTLKRHKTLHFILLVSALVFMGWFSYALVPIRSSAGPQINMNAPDDVFSLHDYINREQYGKRPLLYGSHAGARPDGWEETYHYHFDADKKKYKRVTDDTKPRFNSADRVWFPRMFSHHPPHPDGYEWWTGIDFREERPGLSHQFDFFLRHQMGHSYLRYLLWNFAGRQNDVQGHGDMMSGNWATGIDFIDRYFLGSRSQAQTIDQYSPSANYYFGIPLLLALTGLFFLLRRGRGRRKVLFLLGLLVLMTGPAIVFYLNQPPYEPRERDYIYLASFMGVAMLAGIGIFGLLKKVFYYGDSVLTGVLSGFLLFMAGPGLLFSVNLNDHDRSDRYLARDLAVSQLRSCPPGAVLFTYGDNDTYPLWYANQVENVRPDVRLVNLGLLNTSWYIRGLQQATPGTSGLNTTLPAEFYRHHGIDFFQVSKVVSSPAAGEEVLEGLLEDGPLQKSENHISEQVVHPAWQLELSDGGELLWELTSHYLSSGDLVLADIVSSNTSERPVCFTKNVEEQDLNGLENHLVSHGLVWMLEEETNREDAVRRTGREYQIFMDSITVGREGEAWWDHTCRQALMLSGYRETSTGLARDLLAEDNTEQAASVLTKSLEEWPYSPYAQQSQMIDMARLLFESGQEEEAANLVRGITFVNLQDIYFYVYSGFEPEGVRRKFCRLFTEVRELAAEMKLHDVMLETESKLGKLCGF
ncbi:MAG: DUF2723 domain-containing protein [Marinilabilia sp.]